MDSTKTKALTPTVEAVTNNNGRSVKKKLKMFTIQKLKKLLPRSFEHALDIWGKDQKVEMDCGLREAVEKLFLDFGFEIQGSMAEPFQLAHHSLPEWHTNSFLVKNLSKSKRWNLCDELYLDYEVFKTYKDVPKSREHGLIWIRTIHGSLEFINQTTGEPVILSENSDLVREVHDSLNGRVAIINAAINAVVKQHAERFTEKSFVDYHSRRGTLFTADGEMAKSDVKTKTKTKTKTKAKSKSKSKLKMLELNTGKKNKKVKKRAGQKVDYAKLVAAVEKLVEAIKK